MNDEPIHFPNTPTGSKPQPPAPPGSGNGHDPALGHGMMSDNYTHTVVETAAHTSAARHGPTSPVPPEDELDADGYAKVEPILLLDESNDQLALARKLYAAVTTERDKAVADQRKVATPAQILAIERSGACHLGPFYRSGSWILVGVDTGLWWIALARIFTFAKSGQQLWTLLVALVCAAVGKGAGLLVARVRLTDRLSSAVTIALHERFLRRILPVALITLATWLLLLCLTGFLGQYARYLVWIPLVVLNGCLGIMAGVMASHAATLLRPRRWRRIQTRIDRLDRLRTFLKKRFPGIHALLVASLIAMGPAVAGGACAVVGDPTLSVNVADHQAALGFLAEHLPEMTQAFDCDELMAITIGCTVRHAPRVWLTLPRPPQPTDCAGVEPAPLKGEVAILNYVSAYVEEATGAAVRACLLRTGQERELFRSAGAGAARSMLQFLGSRPGGDCSRITELVANLVESRRFSLIVVVTDLIEPRADISRVVIPPGVQVVVILTRPVLPYARVEDGLARAEEWERHGVTVVTVAELAPGIWRGLTEDTP